MLALAKTSEHKTSFKKTLLTTSSSILTVTDIVIISLANIYIHKLGDTDENAHDDSLTLLSAVSRDFSCIHYVCIMYAFWTNSLSDFDCCLNHRLPQKH